MAVRPMKGDSALGVSWLAAAQGISPWKMAVGGDDRLYVDDYSGQGVVVSFDPTIETNDWREVYDHGELPRREAISRRI